MNETAERKPPIAGSAQDFILESIEQAKTKLRSHIDEAKERLAREDEEERLLAESPGEKSEITGKPKLSKREKNMLVKIVRKKGYAPTEHMEIATCQLLYTYGYVGKAAANGSVRGMAKRAAGKVVYRATPEGVEAAKMVKISLRFGRR